MNNLFDTGIRPAIDDYLAKKSQEQRSYGDYWSASSAGYCMRKLIFERLGVPPIEKLGDERKTRVFEAGHIFHKFIQDITREAGLSVAQELELQDAELMVRGHIDDLVLVDASIHEDGDLLETKPAKNWPPKKLILYDYKTQHAKAFTWQKGRPVSYYHRLQVGTYMYMLRKSDPIVENVGSDNDPIPVAKLVLGTELTEARILKISKDDLRMDENQILWDAQLENDVKQYWDTLNGYWKEQKLPVCSCHLHEGGFMAKEQFNPFFFNGEPCSIELYNQWKESQNATEL